ncbi:carboxypeptidase regulatory-like domain-containing protein [Haloplanus halophilus]|uniref:carboxypeptidase regulatory-like domain-containing protein n=1 Tax=Haloplanus halophilus TaxID=2949993 RepID=UPI00203B080A|nr:carboxypeptidase regulatory-like domain-containing protein [Haloplanus sp. GDY1]
MTRPPVVLCVALILSLVAPAAVAPVGAQSDGGTVTLTVAVSNEAGDPIGDADLDVAWSGGSTTATTAGNGKAFVDVPDGARVEITVTHPRYLRDSPYVVESASEREVSVTVFRKSTLRLDVAGPDGPIADASVLIERGGLDVSTGTTGENGVFETGVLRAGDYTITVTKPGYYVRRKPIRIDGDITNRVALRPGSVSVTVSVEDPHFDPGRPVGDALVTMEGVGDGRTDADGNVTLEVPVNTPTTLRVTKDGYRTVTRDLTVGEENATFTADVSRTPDLTASLTNDRIVAGTRAVVTVTNAYGEPASGVTVTLDGERVGTTDAEGELAVRIDDPGEHTLRASRGSVTSNAVTVEAIAAGDGVTPTADPTPTATDAATETPTGTGAGGPGFTAALAALAVIAAGFLLGRR